MKKPITASTALVVTLLASAPAWACGSFPRIDAADWSRMLGIVAPYAIVMLLLTAGVVWAIYRLVTKPEFERVL